jgi:hypothetical protein
VSVVMIGMKSEYDELIRDTLKNKKETEVIAKQIEMLEKIEKKKNDKLAEAEAHLAEIKRQIEMKQMKLINIGKSFFDALKYVSLISNSLLIQTLD